uniref:terminase gpA endonuclease subunit n=1 Tax=Escherichia coli TaxID=562 RepID=UPI00200CD47D
DCPHCGGHHALTWGGKDEPHGFKWVDGDPETVKHLCPHCGALSTQGDYLAAEESGRWYGTDGSTVDHEGVFRDAAGVVIPPPAHVAFHVWTAYSPLVTWAQIVREFMAASEATQQGDDS